MPPSPPTQQMGEKHEKHLAEVFGGTRTRASGSQWFDQGDGRNHHEQPFAFCWDGKATLGKGINVTREMVANIREQAQGERPALGFRWYGNANLDDVDEDWVAVPAADMEEVLASARAWAGLEAALGSISRDDVAALILRAGMVEGLTSSLADAQQALVEAGQLIARQDQVIREASERAGGSGVAVPQHPDMVSFVPRLPWTVIRMAEQTERRGSAGDPVATVIYYDASGGMRLYTARSLRVQRSMENRPQVFMDEVRVREADVYNAEGIRIARVCDSDPSVEEG
jgi:hypothetical protein